MAEQFVDKEGERKEGEKGGDEGKSSPALKTVLQAAQEERDGRDRAPNTILRARREHPPSKLQSAKVSILSALGLPHQMGSLLSEKQQPG